jgi:hypothetical protein
MPHLAILNNHTIETNAEPTNTRTRSSLIQKKKALASLPPPMRLRRPMELTPLAPQISRMAHNRNNSLMQLAHHLRRPALLPLHQPILPTPRIALTIDPNRIHPHGPRAHNIKRIPTNDPHPRQRILVLGIHPHLPRQVVVDFRGGFEFFYFLDGDDVFEDVGVRFEVRGFGHAAADHGVCAVGEDDGVDVWGRAQLLARAGDVGEDAEGVVGFEQGLEFGLGELEGGFGEGVFEGLDGYEGEVSVLACLWWEKKVLVFIIEMGLLMSCYFLWVDLLTHAVQTPGVFQLVFTPCHGESFCFLVAEVVG